MSENNRHLFFLRLSAISGILAVMLGAFGAHSLKALISSDDLAIYETGICYQFYHTFALLAVGILLYLKPSSLLINSGYAFSIGILFFSGSLYGLALRNLGEVNLNWLGPITPIGGLVLLMGWLLLLLSLKNLKQNSNT